MDAPGLRVRNPSTISVSPPDAGGLCSLGVSVDIVKAASRMATLVIAQVNRNMPRVQGRSNIHVNDIDIFVEHDEELRAIGQYPDVAAARNIARYVSRLVDDGSTMQMSLGATSDANIQALMNELEIVKRELKNSVNLIDKRRKKLVRQRTAYIILFFVLWIVIYFYYSRGFIRR